MNVQIAEPRATKPLTHTQIVPASIDIAARTVNLVWSTGAAVWALAAPMPTSRAKTRAAAVRMADESFRGQHSLPVRR